MNEATRADFPAIPGYTLEEGPRTGGMSWVYRAADGAGRKVAVKVVRPDMRGRPEVRKRFEREAEVAVGLPPHPYIAQLLDFDLEADPAYLVFEYVEGRPLSEAAADGGLPVGRVREIIGRVAEALQVVHANGVVHRDLKPSNIMLGAGNRPSVIDFGIARAEEFTEYTREGAILGTLAYMSPEQARGTRGVGPECDVWALGAVTYFTATGRPPFEGGSEEVILNRIIGSQPELRDCPRELEQVVRACLTKDPAKRPSLQQVASMLSPRPGRPSRRRLLAAGAVAATAVVLAAGLGTWRLLASPACAEGLSPGPKDECVGVTDGALLDPGDAKLTAVQKAIAAENRRAVAGGPGSYVTVAFLGPLTQGSLTGGRATHQLEGAHTAQLRANSGGLGTGVKIRLVLANQGSDESAWKPVAERLKAMADGPDRLVAVVGLGLSQQETLDSMRVLGGRGLPMIGDVVTGDDFDRESTGIGTVRLMPLPVGRQMEIVRDWLRDRPELRTAETVVNEDTTTGRPDMYTISLSKGFQRGPLAAHHRAGGRDAHTFSPGDSLQDVADRLCADKPDLVFFAARASYLPDLLGSLNRRCRNTPMTVVSGSDAVAVRTKPDVVRLLHDPAQPLSLVYVPIAERSTLESARNPGVGQYLDFLSAFTGAGFAPSDLDDGWGIMAHDATLAAAAAVVKASADGRAPTVEEVDEALSSFGPDDTVPGAAGSFAFDPRTGDRDVYLTRPGTGEPFKPRALPAQLGDHCPATGRAGPC